MVLCNEYLIDTTHECSEYNKQCSKKYNLCNFCKRNQLNKYRS